MPLQLRIDMFRSVHRRYFSVHKILNRVNKDIQPQTPAITRFAPSPTGLLHIGSLRTALYNYLLAKKTGGRFILRLEDTDRTRLFPGAEEDIIDILKWCKIDYETPYSRQSDRVKQGVYKEYIDELLRKGFAYRCFCSKERLIKLRFDGYDRNCTKLSQEEQDKLIRENVPHTIRYLMPSQYPTITDLLHGKISIPSRKGRTGYDDPVLIKSDGFPTYHFANVVDDHLMNITHVIRGEEWLASTPKHIALYYALGWDPPKYVHIPLLTDIDNGKKLSKRKGNTPVIQLRHEGFFSEAVVNFVALLGWSPPRKNGVKVSECFTMDQLIESFNLNNLTRGNVKVDPKKLFYFNKKLIQSKIKSNEIDTIVKEIAPVVKASFPNSTEDKIKSILLNCYGSLTTLQQFNGTFYYFFERPNYNNESIRDFLKVHHPSFLEVILQQALIEFRYKTKDVPAIVDGVIELIPEHAKTVAFETMRIALTGSVSGPQIAVIVTLLGKEESMARWRNFQKFLSTYDEP